MSEEELRDLRFAIRYSDLKSSFESFRRFAIASVLISFFLGMATAFWLLRR